MDDKDLETVFLDEMQALERFRIAYMGAHPNVPLHRDDPDVARMIEALAFFSARARRAASTRLDDALLRLFRATFDELLRPMPPACLVKAVPNSRFVEVAELSSETDVLLRLPADNPLANDKLYRFTTLRPMRLLPAELEAVDNLRRGPLGTRIALRFESRFPRSEPLGRIAIHVSHLGDFASSATLMHALKTHIVGVSVVVDQRATADSFGVPCTYHFGEPTLDDPRGEAIPNALERERLFFRFPQQANFLEIEVPPHVREWKRFAICIDVGPKWPSSLRLSAEMLHLGVVAAVNRTHDFAVMLEEDGTTVRHPVAAQSTTDGLRPQAVLSVNRVTDIGFEPLEHGSLRGARGGWEAISTGTLKDRRAYVEVALPGTFEEPQQLAVDALWFQPEVNDVDVLALVASLASRYVEGIDWGLLGTLTKASASVFERDRESVLRLLAMRQEAELRTEDLRFLLEALGADFHEPFARIVRAIANVTTVIKPFARHATGLKLVVSVELEGLDAASIPFLDIFGHALTRVLRAWSPREVVEVHLLAQNLDLRCSYTP
jgi:type VI secretion system protein ImpG